MEKILLIETDKNGKMVEGMNHIQERMVEAKSIDAVLSSMHRQIQGHYKTSKVLQYENSECITCAVASAQERIKEIVTNGEYEPKVIHCAIEKLIADEKELSDMMSIMFEDLLKTFEDED